MSIFEPTLAMEYAKGEGDIVLQHITAPRPSCLETRAAYLKLRRLCIDEIAIINTFVVRRRPTTKANQYAIGDKWLTFQEALDVIEGRKLLPMVQLALPLAVADAA